MRNYDVLGHKLDLYKIRFIFSRYRFHLRFLVCPFFLCFSFLDYWYLQENFLRWFVYRIFFIAIVFLLFIPVAKFRNARKHIDKISVFITALACNIVNLMVYESGGYLSKYFIGTILCAMAGTQLFKLNRLYGFITQIFSFLPLILILFYSSPDNTMKDASIQSLFLLGMAVLSFIFGSSDEENTHVLFKMKQKMKEEIDRLNRTENLKKFFPIIVRQEIERNPAGTLKKKKMKNIVIGFADIINSTQIANNMDIEMDWVLKEKFLESATSLALKNNLVVLTHLGDGFLFIVNYVNHDLWQENLFSFFNGLTKEYDNIFSSMVGVSGSVKSGVKFGLAKGDVMIGFLGVDQAYFTAIGPTVNLASRICSKADSNELIVTDDLWLDLSAFVGGLSFDRLENNQLRGFANTWNLVRIFRKSSHKNKNQNPTCPTCGGPTKLGENRDGNLDYICIYCASNRMSSAS